MATTEEVIIDVKTEGTQQAEQQLDDVAKSTDELTESTDEYSKSLKENAKNVQFFGVSLNSLQSGYRAVIGGIKSSVVALKSFKVALSATGIGLLLVALGSLVTFLTKTQKGLDIVTRVTDQLSAAFTVIIDRIGLVGRAITKLFQGDFSGAWDDVKDSVTGLGAEIADVAEKAGVLSDAFAQLRDEQIKNIVIDARLRKELKQYNKDAEDTSLTLERRAEASAKAEAVERQRIENSIRLQQEEIRIIQERQALGNNIAEDNRELAEAQAELFRIQEESLERLTTQGNKTNLLYNSLRDSIKVTGQASVKAFKLEEEQAGLSLDFTKKKAEFEQETAKETGNVIGGIANSLAIFGKEGAIAQAFIQLGVAIARVTAQTGIGAPAAIAAIIPGVVAAISTIKQAAVPQPPSFATGGMINGPSHKRGGVLIEAEGGEYIINRRAMRDPSVRSAAEALNNVVPKYQFGGRVPDTTSSGAAIAAALANVPRTIPVLYKETLDEVNNRVAVTEQAATL